ncbi:MAG: SPOR domain-containing protein [Alphaproteobacteria bacterium]|nr:SPOR domain-containing protein [Alphaproteobacteria bacterium]
MAQVAARSVWRVQIASLPSQDAAQGVWTKAQSGNIHLLGALSPNFEKAEINGRGTYFRVQTQAFNDRKAANDLCNSLKARNMSCLVVRTAG